MARGRTDNQAGSLPGAAPQGERRPGLRAIGATASRIAAPIVRRQGGGVLARLKAEWSAIVGAELAAVTWPDRLGRDGVLKLRVVPGLALELQHRAPMVIERINLYFGRDAVVRLVLVQAPLPLAAASPKPPPAELAAGEAQALDKRLADVADPELREALAGLGRLVLGTAPRGDGPGD
jgi:hypothetical protein